MTRMPGSPTRLKWSLLSWFDNRTGRKAYAGKERTGVDAARVFSFVVLHGGCLAVIWVGWSGIAVATAIALYLVRAFFVTAFYHRYFSHKTFKTSRPVQLAFAILGNSAVQRGPLWWAAHHRHHHRHADEEADPHSPGRHGLYWSHMGWITARENFATREDLVPDLLRYPELRWLDRFDTLVPLALAALLFGVGALLEAVAPGLGTSGPQMVVWGFFVSTVILFHVTSLVNSAAHRIGGRRFDTRDDSRNSLLVALLTLGEGWHNNHHHYPAATRQGFYWWEIDPTYYGLKAMSWIGVIWDIQPVPRRILAGASPR